MNTWKSLIPLAAVSIAALAAPASAQNTIKIGELNSYKAAPAFLDPYKRGIELALDEVNASGGVLGRKMEFVIRDDGANPGDAVRVAEELVTREGTNLIAGTFLSNVGLAVTEFAGKKQVSSWRPSRSPTRSPGRTATNIPIGCALRPTCKSPC